MDGVNAIDDVNRDCRSIAAPCKTIHKALSQMAAGEEINTLLTNYGNPAAFAFQSRPGADTDNNKTGL